MKSRKTSSLFAVIIVVVLLSMVTTTFAKDRSVKIYRGTLDSFYYVDPGSDEDIQSGNHKILEGEWSCKIHKYKGTVRADLKLQYTQFSPNDEDDRRGVEYEAGTYINFQSTMTTTNIVYVASDPSAQGSFYEMWGTMFWEVQEEESFSENVNIRILPEHYIHQFQLNLPDPYRIYGSLLPPIDTVTPIG